MNEYIFGKYNLYEMDCQTLEKKWILEIHNKKYVVNEKVDNFIEKYKVNSFNENNLDEVEQQIFELLKNVGYFSSENKSPRNKDYARLIFKKKIFFAQSLKHLKVFTFLFSKVVMIPILLLILMNIVCVFYSFPHMKKSNGSLVSMLLLLLCSTIFHEIGHISASIRYGIVPRWAGVGIYFTSPVAFVDVDETWKLPQKQRFIVDVGGIYFQLIIVCIYSSIYSIFKKFVFLQAAYLLIISAIFNLNPFLKYDGYWVFSDILGVYNLN